MQNKKIQELLIDIICILKTQNNEIDIQNKKIETLLIEITPLIMKKKLKIKI